MKTLLLRLLPPYQFRKNRLSKIALFSGFMLSGSLLFAQERHYAFSVQNVTDYGKAKDITDILRPVFNTQEAPFTVFPLFDDEQDVFDFHSAVIVSREQLQEVLQLHGLVLTSWISEEYSTNAQHQ